MNRKLGGGSGSKTKTKGLRDKASFATISFTSFVFPRNNGSKQLTMIFLCLESKKIHSYFKLGIFGTISANGQMVPW